MCSDWVDAGHHCWLVQQCECAIHIAKLQIGSRLNPTCPPACSRPRRTRPRKTAIPPKQSTRYPAAMRSNPPARRWFRFSLRTLLVAITVLGLWLGYYVNWMHERRAARIAPEVLVFADRVVEMNRAGKVVVVPPPHPFSSSLAILGEQSVNGFLLRGSRKDSENQRLAERYQKLFPESELIFVFDAAAQDSENLDLANRYHKLLPESQFIFVFKGSSNDPASRELEDRYYRLLPECAEVAFADDIAEQVAAHRREMRR